MAKQTLVALVLASLLVAGLAADASRSLQQANYDCAGAKRIAKVKNGCNLLCTCAGSLNKNLATPNMRKFCNTQCKACSDAAQKCKTNALPKECEAGRSFKEIGSCINTFLQSQSGRH